MEKRILDELVKLEVRQLTKLPAVGRIRGEVL